VDRLVEELLREAATFGGDYPEVGPEARLVQVLLDRLPALAVAPLLHLGEPKSEDLRRIAHAIAEHPADARTIDEWAGALGVTKRTLTRRFVAETRLAFGQWRSQARMLHATERLAMGESVTAVAFDVGYEDVSSFIAAFKAAMGETPAKYFKSPTRNESPPRSPR
jgi:AraC-like DNA-binding protein